MNEVVTLAIGVLAALCILAALLWSVARALATRGMLRRAHLLFALLVLSAMASITVDWPIPARISGVALALAAVWVAAAENGKARLMPLIGAGFGLAVAAGLPF